MNIEDYKPAIDAIIFASDTPLSIQRIKQIVEEVSGEQISTKDIRAITDEINRDNKEQQRGFFLQEVAGGYQFRTRPNYAGWVKKLKKTKQFRPTQSTMETLAIIAYKQPLIRAEIEKIRGVDSGGIVKNLLERNIIKIVGRKNIPGRPFLLGTTKKFLEVFGLEKLSDLPSLKDFENLDESKLPTILQNRLSENMIEDYNSGEEDLITESGSEAVVVADDVASELVIHETAAGPESAHSEEEQALETEPSDSEAVPPPPPDQIPEN